jgi:EAL domain-containing protein (putative c-di-GMP-specific phosphodiesterase class I)
LLTLELAESTVMGDVDATLERLEQIKPLGVRIAIDDFGSAYAHRAELERMPLDCLKVDRGSLAESGDEAYRSWLLEGILSFGRDLSLMLIAKHVETQEQLSELQEMGFTMVQGFLTGPPAAADVVQSLVDVDSSAPAPIASTV